MSVHDPHAVLVLSQRDLRVLAIGPAEDRARILDARRVRDDVAGDLLDGGLELRLDACWTDDELPSERATRAAVEAAAGPVRRWARAAVRAAEDRWFRYRYVG